MGMDWATQPNTALGTVLTLEKPIAPGERSAGGFGSFGTLCDSGMALAR
jgi:hypothetical protein